MKTKSILWAYSLGALFILGILSAFTLKPSQVENAYLGNWQTKEANLKVRTKNKGYVFTNVTVPVSLTINNNKASGYIGDVKFNGLPITKNKGNVNAKGVIYIAKFGEVGRLNANDPAATKKVELWIKPQEKPNQLMVEVRQMFTMDAFPMGEITLTKQP